MRSRLLLSLLGFLCLVVLSFPSSSARAEGWEPISPEELALKDDPLNPGAHAVILYRALHTDHPGTEVTYYHRIKILTDEGKEYGDVEIPFFKGASKVKDLRARTIRPDGTLVPFTGEVFEKTVYKRKRLKTFAKTFSLPEVEVGSIIEYTYKLEWSRSGASRVIEEIGRPYGLDWTVQRELSLLRGDFRVKPYPSGFRSLYWTLVRMPEGVQLVEEDGGWWGLTVENIPAFKQEEFMPPKEIYAMGVKFYYREPLPETNEEFWNRTGKERHQWREEFIGNRKKIRQEVGRLVQPSDSPEEKLRKLYVRAQAIENLALEPEKTEKERKRQKRKIRKNVKDVLERGYGYPREINYLFIALARAAGLEAESVSIVTRDERLFEPDIRDWDQFNDMVAWVRLGEQELYLDPGNPFAPYGQLAWEQTSASGVRLHKEGVEFVTLPPPETGMAVYERRATLALDEEGTLSGTVTVALHGLGGMAWRARMHDEDEVERRDKMEEAIKNWLPAGATVEIEEMSGWEENDQPLQVKASVRVAEFAAMTGRRLLLPTGIFQTKDKFPLEHLERTYPVYFSFPWEEKDEVAVELPEGFELEALPEEKKVETAFGRYELSCRKERRAMRVQRQVVVAGILFPTDTYSSLRAFFSSVKSGDDQYAVLETVAVGRRQ